jgi:outer membrane protein OmpA-like peptidoglycan-associated protein
MKDLLRFACVAALAVMVTGPALAFDGSEACQRADRLFQAAPEADGPREKALLEAKALCPGHHRVLNDLGLIRENQGRLSEAEAFYRKSIDAKAGYAPPFAGLGDVLKARGDAAAAVGAYEEFLRLAKYDPRWAAHIPAYRERLAQVKKDVPEVVETKAIVTALTTLPAKMPRMRGVSVTKRPLNKPHIDVAILFEFNSAAISAPSIRQIEQVARALKTRKLRGKRILVEGHTDSAGTAVYNMDLSRRRAESVRALLADRFQVSTDRLESRGMGETTPVDSNETDAGRAHNRRVTFINVN